ncbi:MAG TPA: FAD-dependent monooxygenase [Candidatus Cybelea sp.]|jgi:2-polyprenyl-6-methoxyphenol hydroxylase-like FAD-dependent oxidoreductase|nr:FAD-dependent monooxygenase [Candidatus Cybelea sp.]
MAGLGEMTSTGVLIAGAGPTGLALALNLARRGVPFRLIDEAAGPGEHSRAMVVQARTLEFYDQFGFAREMIGEGIVVPEVHLREADRRGRLHEMLKLKFDDLGAGISPFPFALTYPQDDHERFLVKKLAESGVTVEWNTKLESFTQRGDGVTATVTGPDGSEEIAASYLCGCDGAHSAVRTTLELGFAGMTYEQLFFVCDAQVDAAFDHDLYVTLGEYALLLMFPVRSSGMRRLIGLVPSGIPANDALTFDSIRARIEPLLNVRVTEVNWFSTYRVHHRVAERFRSGRAFILGDAAHIHSPAGGQGMNTGIGDAMNLGWKLADVLRGRAAERILDSFEEERIGFARALVATTDRAFTALVAPGARGTVMRRVIAPLLVAGATRLPRVRRALFRIVSQTQIHYPDSSLSEGKAGGVRGGDRLPWVESLDNFAPLRSLDWQAHVYGQPGIQVRETCERLDVPVHAFGWNGDAERAGLARDATYLIRPDGYVAVALGGNDVAPFEAYVMRIGLGPTGA